MRAGVPFRAPAPVAATPGSSSQRLLPEAADPYFRAERVTVNGHALTFAPGYSVLIALEGWRLIEGDVGAAQILQTGLVGFGYFATVAIALALGTFTKASEDLAAQRGIDVANLEQVNRLIIQEASEVDNEGTIECHQRLGGMLNYYYRAA